MLHHRIILCQTNGEHEEIEQEEERRLDTRWQAARQAFIPELHKWGIGRAKEAIFSTSIWERLGLRRSVRGAKVGTVSWGIERTNGAEGLWTRQRFEWLRWQSDSRRGAKSLGGASHYWKQSNGTDWQCQLTSEFHKLERLRYQQQPWWRGKKGRTVIIWAVLIVTLERSSSRGQRQYFLERGSSVAAFVTVAKRAHCWECGCFGKWNSGQSCSSPLFSQLVWLGGAGRGAVERGELVRHWGDQHAWSDARHPQKVGSYWLTCPRVTEASVPGWQST